MNGERFYQEKRIETKTQQCEHSLIRIPIILLSKCLVQSFTGCLMACKDKDRGAIQKVDGLGSER